MKPEGTNPPDSTRSASWAEQPLEWPRATGHVGLLMSALEVRQKRQQRRRLLRTAGGAVALLAAGLAWWLVPQHQSPPGLAVASLGTASVSRPERTILPDGSIVEQKAGTEITVSFQAGSPGTRHITLHRGEAHFEVAKDPARTFVVEARGVRVRAVGTAFSVGVGESSIDTLVTEGTVAVDPAPDHRPAPGGASAPDAAILLQAGQRVVVDTSKPVVAAAAVIPASADDISRILAWRVPRLEFNETPLWEVVSLLNQHSGSRISLAHPHLGRLEISGVLRADNIDPLLQMLQTNYHIRVTRRPGGDIELAQHR